MKSSVVDTIVAAAEDKKAIDIQLIRLSGKSSVTDCLIICSVSSRPQMKAVADEISERLRIKNKWQGILDSNWMILDLGDIVVHVMGLAERDYYKLEDIWEKSGIIYHL